MSSKGKGVIAGVILSLPILAVMIALLASADSVFSQLIRIDLSFFENLGSLGIVQKTVIAIITNKTIHGNLIDTSVSPRFITYP